MRVAIVGAGIAGLTAAVRLHRAGCEVIVHEAADQVGGRVATDHRDGLTLDRGFQVFNPAYTEARGLFGLTELAFRPLARGLLLRTSADRLLLPWQPSAAVTLLRQLGVADAGRLASYLAGLLPGPPGRLRGRPDVSIRAALLGAGVGEGTLTTLLVPFLSGVLLEADLATSRRFGDEILRSFLLGVPGVPQGGMGRIPAALAAQLPAGSIRLGSTVDDCDELRRDPTGTPEAIIVATDADAARRLLPHAVAPTSWHAVTTWYHLAPAAARGPVTAARGVLVLDGRSGAGSPVTSERPRVVNTIAMSDAVPQYATAGRRLIATSALGVHSSPAAEAAIRAQAGDLHGADSRDWQHVATYPITRALPAMPVPLRRPRDPHLGDGIFLAGDHCDVSSLQGAMRSGRRAAQAVLAARRLRRARTLPTRAPACPAPDDSGS